LIDPPFYDFDRSGIGKYDFDKSPETPISSHSMILVDPGVKIRLFYFQIRCGTLVVWETESRIRGLDKKVQNAPAPIVNAAIAVFTGHKGSGPGEGNEDSANLHCNLEDPSLNKQTDKRELHTQVVEPDDASW